MKPSRLGLRFIALVCVGWISASCDSAPQDSAPTVTANEPAQHESVPAAVTAENLLRSERYWPYRVALTQPLSIPGREAPLPAGFTGVLIRVEESGLPRIDFSSRGKLEVPLEKTDLLERANRIRTGSLEKLEPNFIHAIKSRMLDPEPDTLSPLALEASSGRPGFLCVFADPAAPGFDELARALTPLRDRHQVMTILFAQGEHPDPELRDRLRALGWTVPFLYDFLSEPYTRTLVPDGTAWPWWMLQTAEGRVVEQGPWRANTADLVAALDAEFGGGDPREPAELALAR